MNATALVIVLISTATTLVTLLVYERVVRDLRWELQRSRDHIASCQHLIAAMTRHPAGSQMGPTNLRLVRLSDSDTAS